MKQPFPADWPVMINLGCGNAPEDGFINHDIVKHSPHVDVVWNLDDLPWPWPDGCAQRIVAKSVIEHLRLTPVESINECWRIMKTGGFLFVKMPLWNHPITHRDPTHRWKTAPGMFDYFDPTTSLGKTYTFYTPYKWRIVTPEQMNSGKSSLMVTMQKIV
jgi:predicted SAM-dependent methyltransferase